jgi:hypothetical protein
MPRPSIRPWLTKWYLDCITRKGDCFIGYAGRVRLGPIGLAVTSALLGFESGPTTRRWRLLDGRVPKGTAAGEVGWKSRWLGVHGQWTTTAPSRRRVLHESDALRVTWECMVPGGRARVRFGGADLEGYGYAECLSVTGDPAALGLRELLWGHFAGPLTQLVWLVWRGAEPLTLVLWNGEEVPGATVPDAGVVLARGQRLAMGAPRVLRSGGVGDTIPAALRLLVPASLYGIREEKWIAEAQLGNGRDPAERGWAIYERVTWP